MRSPAPRSPDSTSPPVTVVVATRNRREGALHTVARLRELPEQPPVIVVDDRSDDGTAAAVRQAFPEVVVLGNAGAPGATGSRNTGVRAAETPFVAFADDDSWWAPGALTTAVAHLAAHPRLGVLAGRILVGEDERLDRTCEAMAASPLPSPGLPGPRVLGFVACGAVVRRIAYLEVGGFPEDYVVGGEEEPLALALAGAGWDVAYVDAVVAHHVPTRSAGDRAARDRRVTRNDLMTAWRHRPLDGALRQTVRLVRASTGRARRRGLADGLREVPRALRERRPVPREVEALRRLLDPPSPGLATRLRGRLPGR